MMCVLVNVYRASIATFEKVKSYQLPLFSIQGIYKSDYSKLSRKRLILRSIGGPEPALRHSGERDKGKPITPRLAARPGASWGDCAAFLPGLRLASDGFQGEYLAKGRIADHPTGTQKSDYTPAQ
jgi:hypothetical protein